MTRETILRKRTFHTVLMAIEVLEMAVFLLPALYFGAGVLLNGALISMLLFFLLFPGGLCRFLIGKTRPSW